MGTFRKWMALPMGLTALALGWLLVRQMHVGTLSIMMTTAATFALTLGTFGEWQKSRGRAWLPLSFAALFAASLVLSVVAFASSERPAASGAAGSTFSSEDLAKARASGKPVFVYFTADWCLSCKANEAGAINREAVQEAFKANGVVTLVGDWTNGDPTITRTLAEHGRNSVPLYLWYAPGAAKPEILPQILTPGMLTDWAAR